QRDCLRKASHLIAHWLVESAAVIGDHSQRHMAMKAHQEKTCHCNRAVFNDGGLYRFAQVLECRCLRFRKELHRIDERYTSKDCSACGHGQDMPLWKRTYRCGTGGLVMDRDVNSAIQIRQRFLAQLAPHTEQPVRCAALQA